MSRLFHRCRDHGDETGFTIVELVLALALAAFAFTASAALLFSATKVLSVQKSRTQGNDLATIAIEDLQRLKYDQLGLCSSPPGTPPAQMSDTVFLPNCSATATAWGPCEAALPPSSSVYPDESYTCTTRNIVYTVKRYVAFGNAAHTIKRLAVFVEWTDRGGRHEVAQQSSLRIPSQTFLIGNPPPQVTSSAVTGGTIPVDGTGFNTAAVNLTATATGLTSTDAVFAVFETIGNGGREQKSLALTSSTGTSWTGTMPVAFARFGPGTQWVTFTALRSSDGKVGSSVSDPATVVTGGAPVQANVFMHTEPPSTATVDSTGLLTADLTMKVTTDGISPAGSVSVSFATLTGAVTLAMANESQTGQCDKVNPCNGRWTITIRQADGYHFAPGAQRFYFTALQPASSAYLVDNGSTVTVSSQAVTFG